jgi:HAD superfamily hydrolase (TIGR01549 family)
MAKSHDIKIVSFDVEGTLVTSDFSYAVWFEAIPGRYAEKNDISLELARKAVEEEYRKVGDQRLEWYDIRYWFDKLGLGSPIPVMKKCQGRVRYYPDVKDVLSYLSDKYILAVASGSSRDFLEYLLKDIRHYFSCIYSSISDYQQLKTSRFYEQICQAMQVNPQKVVHIGDNWQFDFVTPAEIGIKAFHLDREGKLGKLNSLSSLLELKKQLIG